MAYQKGSDMLLKIDTAPTGGPTYSTVGGIQTKELQISADAVDVTNQDSSGKWRELLESAGIKKMSVTGRGVFSDTSAENQVHTCIINNTIKSWQLIAPGLGTYTGLFQVTQFSVSGAHDKEVQFDIRLESAGAITFTAS